MPAAIASAALIVVASLVTGQAILAVCGRRERTATAGPIGLAALLCAAAIAAGLGGRGAAIAIVVGIVVLVAAIVLARGSAPPEEGAGGVAGAVVAGSVAAIAAAIPFIAAGAVGILGVGLVNDDMASHLLLADWIDERFRPEPVLIDQGYPLGPHALVAGLATVLHAGSVDVFAGLTLAIPALTAIVAFSALEGLGRVARIAAAVVVALPYLGAAYLAQEAFKEPIIALFVLAYALLLARARDWRDAIALGVLAAGTIYVYSFPGLAWLAGVTGVWAVIIVLQSRRSAVGDRESREWPGVLALVAGAATLAILVVPELGRLADFADFRALHPDRANEGGLGNLPGQISPLTALGVWPSSEFRLSAGAGDLPAIVFYAGGLFAATALAVALPGWIRRHGWAVPAALIAAAVLYLVARGLGTVYTSAKALSIAAPLVALIALGGLLASSRGALRALGVLFGLAAAVSSLLILRQAPVAPTAHADELASIRPLVAGEKLLFLGRDNFILHELRGSKPFTHVRNFYDPYFVEPNFDLEQVGSKFDFDSVTAQTLARFPFVLTTGAAYASGPPPGYAPIRRTDSYVLWERRRSPLGREPGETSPAPGRTGGCPATPPARAEAFAAAPVLAEAGRWSQTTVESGESATTELDLPPGVWELSLQYDATRPLTLTGDGLDTTLPGNLDYRGTAPFWPVGRIAVSGGGPVEISATVERPPFAGRLLGAHSVAHLGALAATLAEPARQGCGGYVDWYLPARAD